MTGIPDPNAPLPAATRRRIEQADDTRRDPVQSADDDAELLTAWACYAAAVAAIPRELADEDYEAAWRPADAFSDKIMVMPAYTPAGIAAKLKLQLVSRCNFAPYHAALIRGVTTPVDDHLKGWLDRMLWQSIHEVERLAGAVQPVPVPKVDHFAEAVEAMAETAEVDIEAAAILKAGAAAAGVTIEQARKVWTTMAALVAGPMGAIA